MENRCIDHPKYKGIRRPDIDCVECLNMYIDMLEEEIDSIKSNIYTGNDE